jgi:hypothetical protein
MDFLFGLPAPGAVPPPIPTPPMGVSAFGKNRQIPPSCPSPLPLTSPYKGKEAIKVIIGSRFGLGSIVQYN